MHRYRTRSIPLGLVLAFGVAAAAAAEDEPVWSSFADETMASVVYAVPDSDDMRFVLFCDRRKRSVDLTVYEEIAGAKLRQSLTITFTAGSAKASVKGQTATDEMNGFIFGQAKKVAPSTILAVLQAGGDLVVGLGAKTTVTFPDKGRAAAAAEFAKACPVK